MQAQHSLSQQGLTIVSVCVSAEFGLHQVQGGAAAGGSQRRGGSWRAASNVPEALQPHVKRAFIQVSAVCSWSNPFLRCRKGASCRCRLIARETGT